MRIDYRYLSLSLSLFREEIADPTKSNRNHSRGKRNGRKGRRGEVEAVPVEIGGSTRPILPKPHLIIPIESEQGGGRGRKDRVDRGGRGLGYMGNTSKFS